MSGDGHREEVRSHRHRGGAMIGDGLREEVRSPRHQGGVASGDGRQGEVRTHHHWGGVASGDGRQEVRSGRHPGGAMSGGGRRGEARSSRHRGDVTGNRLQRSHPHNGSLPLQRNWRENCWTIQVYQVKHTSLQIVFQITVFVESLKWVQFWPLSHPDSCN